VNRSAYVRSKRASRKPDGKTWPDITPVTRAAALGCLRPSPVARSLRSVTSFGLLHFSRSPWNGCPRYIARRAPLA
jgi:hypothetical protein